MTFPIDVVIPWVDGSDPKWLEEKKRYMSHDPKNNASTDTSNNRYRDWDNTQYIFRGIERYMPWVRKVHLVTNGQKPAWLNINAKKLNWVKHSDYIPAKYLPTFSSHPIELNLHRIKKLSEHFIYFNDDMFVIRPTKKTDFFSKKGLPKDQAVFWRITSPNYDEVFWHILLNNMGVINRNFTKNQVIKHNWTKLASIRNGLLAPFLDLAFLPTNHIPGFLINHIPQPFLRSVFIDLWNKEHDLLDKVSSTKFRSAMDVNQYLIKEWQIASGRFAPKNVQRITHNFSIFPKQMNDLKKALHNHKYETICINDVEVQNFSATKDSINASFEKLFPSKSEFEL